MDGDNVRSEAQPMDLGLSALRQKIATVLWRVPPLRPPPVLFLSAFCWCSFAGTLPPVGFPTRPRSGFRVGESCRHVFGEGVEDHRVVGTDRGVDSEMVELFRELVGWWSWFQAVTHERWMRPLVRITPPSCAEPMCEAGSAHHPTLSTRRVNCFVLEETGSFSFILLIVSFLT